MNLSDVLHQMMQESQAAAQPTDLRLGTVTKAEPLEISINPQMAPLQRSVLYLTESVVEKTLRGGPEGMICSENGADLPAQGGTAALNRGLQVGDKVLLLRVQSGQKFIVLSRIF